MTWVQSYLVPTITALGGVAGVSALVDGLMRRKKAKVDLSKVLVDSAISMTDRLRKEVNDLDAQLRSTKETASELKSKLDEANSRASELKNKHDGLLVQFTDAQSEIRALRLQVKILTAELDKHTGTDPWKQQR